MKTATYMLFVWLTSMVSLALGAEDDSLEIRYAMVKKTNETLDRVEAMFAKRGYPFERSAMDVGNVNVWQYDKFPEKVEKINLYKHSILDVYFLSKDLQIIHFYLEAQEGKAVKRDSKLQKFTEIPEAKLSKEEAIEIAKEFAIAVMGKFPTNVGKPVVRRVVPYESTAVLPEGAVFGHEHGKWMLYWPRVTEEGYPFNRGEHIWIDLFENVGPTFLGVKMMTQFDKVDFTPVKKEEVLDIAQAKAKEVMKWKPAREMFGGLELDPEPRYTSLEVVRPNHLTKRKTIPSDGGDIKGRLAWEFLFACYAPNQKRKPSNAQCLVIVWIDAENKKFLGGDIQGR